MRKLYDIVPCPKPRQTRADKYLKRPPVMRYRAFADECRLKMKAIQLDGRKITFHVPMPKSWPKYKRADMEGTPHRQRPDIDNFAKAVLDAIHPEDDSHIADITLSKRWAIEGAIEVEDL
jgi:Holliday junction resolvase RusA-like endonuclease